MEPQNRRDFGKALLAGPVAVALTGEAAAQPALKPSEELAKQWTEIIRLRYGSRLKDGDLAKIERRLLSNLFTQNVLNAVPIDNSDEPDFVFEANEG